MLDDLLHFMWCAARRRGIQIVSFNIAHRSFGCNNRIAGLGKAQIFPCQIRAREDSSTMTLSFLSLKAAVFWRLRVDTVEFHSRVDEVVAHAGDAFAADRIDIAVVRLLLGEMAVDESLRDVEDNSVGEASAGQYSRGDL